MAIYAQSSCTLSTITDVEAVYTYYYLSDSTITVNEAPKDNINPPGASSITIVSEGENYVWTLTEPELDIEDDVIQTAVGKLYYIECVEFSDGTYDWGPLMTSSTYAAAKAAYNLSSQALSQAQAANNATALLGGHFIYNSTWETTNTPHSANVVQTVLKNGVDKTQVPSEWEHNVHIGSNGISLRYNEAVMVQLAANQSGNNTALRFYKPPTINGSTTTQEMLTMELTNSALNFYNPSDGSTEQATLNANGLILKKGGIEAGRKNTSDYIYVYSHDDSTNHTFNINSSGDKFDWRVVAGNNFGVDKAGNLYASNATISGKIVVGNDSIINGTAASTITSNITKALAIVSIEVLSINWTTSNATLSAILKVNESNVSPTTYTWTKNNDTTLPSTDQSITIDDFDATYTCTVEWNDLEGNTLTQSGTLDFKAFTQVYDEASKHAENYLSSEDSKVMIYDGTTNNQQMPSTPLSTTNNVCIDADTISIRRGNIPLAVFSSTGVLLYAEGKSNPIASYGESTIIGDEQDFHIKISTNGGLEFFNQQDQVAYMDADTLFITNSKISNKLRIGKFIWKIRDKNRISFRYEPE